MARARGPCGVARIPGPSQPPVCGSEPTVAHNPTDPPPAEPRQPDAGLQTLLGQAPRARRLARWWRWLVAAVVIVAGLAGGYAWLAHGGSAAPQYRTAAVTRGDLVVTVTATGNLQPTNQVDVGSELSGTIESVLVDVNDTRQARPGAGAAGYHPARATRSRTRAAAWRRPRPRSAGHGHGARDPAAVRPAQAHARRPAGTVPAQVDLDTAEAAWQRAVAAKANANAAVDAGARHAQHRPDQPGQGDHPLADRRRGAVAQDRAGPDRGRLAAGPGAVHAGRGPVQDGVAGGRRRGRRRPGARRPAGASSRWTPIRAASTRPGSRRVSYGSQVKDGVVSYLTDADGQQRRPVACARA